MQILVSRYPTSGIWHSVGSFEARGKAHAVGTSMGGRQERMDVYTVLATVSLMVALDATILVPVLPVS